MSPADAVKCKKCEKVVLWQMLAGMRVSQELRIVGRATPVLVYSTRCDCGTVLRKADGTRVKAAKRGRR